MARSRLLRNVGWNYVAGLANMFALVGLYPFAVKASGVDSYGVWIIGFGLVQFLMVADLGMAAGAVRFIAVMVSRDGLKSDFAEIVGFIVGIFTLLGFVLGTGCFIGLVFYFDRTTAAESLSQTDVLFLVCISSGSLFLGFVGRGAIAVYWGLNEYDLERKIAIAAVAVRSVGIFVAFQFGLGVVVVATVEALTLVLPGLLCLILGVRRFGIALPRSAQFVQIVSGVMKFGSKAFIGAFASAAAVQIPNFLLGAFLGPSSVVAYNALLRVYTAGRACLSWITSPAMNWLIRVQEESGARRHLASSRVVLCACLSVAAVIGFPLAVFPSPLVDLWLGAGYESVIVSFPVVGGTVVLSAVVLASTCRANSRGYAGLASVGSVTYMICAVVATWWFSTLQFSGIALVAPFIAVIPAVPIFLVAGRVRSREFSDASVDLLIVLIALSIWMIVCVLCRWLLGPAVPSVVGAATVGSICLLSVVSSAAVGFRLYRRRPRWLSPLPANLESS